MSVANESAKSKGPVLIEMEEAGPGPDQAPMVPELGGKVIAPPEGRAMRAAMTVAGGRRGGLAGWFWAAALGLLGFVISLAAWDFVAGLLTRSPVLGAIGFGLLLVLALGCLIAALRELAGWSRLRRLDQLRREAEAALRVGDLRAAREQVTVLARLYAGREDLAWGLARLQERKGENVAAEAELGLAEAELLAPLDAQAVEVVASAARLVATATAVVPLAFADVAVALVANLRMIRKIAEIYGGRAGFWGSWRLIRTVLAHLVATGAVAVGDDLIQTLAGGGLVSKLSRRFGEGVVNGALTARVGVAAVEVCRPLPFIRTKRPSVTALVRRALTGLFGQAATQGGGRG